MNTRSRIAFWCYLLSIVGTGVVGLSFILRYEFMPYHSVAVGMPWSQVPDPFQILIMGLLRLAGGAWFTVAIAELWLLLIPFRQGARWAIWAVPAVGLLHYAGVANAMAHVTLNTDAVPPWGPSMVSVVLILTGAALSIPGGATRDPAPRVR